MRVSSSKVEKAVWTQRAGYCNFFMVEGRQHHGGYTLPFLLPSLQHSGLQEELIQLDSRSNYGQLARAMASSVALQIPEYDSFRVELRASTWT